MFKLLVSASLALTATTGVEAGCPSGYHCYGQPNADGHYPILAKGLSALQATLHDVHMTRAWFSVGPDTWGSLLGLLQKDGKNVYASLDKFLPTNCVSGQGPFEGSGCQTWTTDNATHPLVLSGRIPQSHVMVHICLNNIHIMDTIYAATHPDVLDCGAECDFAKTNPWQMYLHHHYMRTFSNYCGPYVFAGLPVAPCSLLPNKDGGAVYPEDPKADYISFSTEFAPGGTKGLSHECCEAALVMVSDMVQKDSTLSAYKGHVDLCQAKSADYGALFNDAAEDSLGHKVYESGCSPSSGTTPSALAKATATAKIRADDCMCGGYILGNVTKPAVLKTALDKDADGILDACTTAAPTTAPASSDDSDSGAYGLTASVSALVAALFASLM